MSLGEVSVGVDGIDDKDASCIGSVSNEWDCMDGATWKGEAGSCLSRLSSSPVLSIDLRRLSTSSTVMENTDDLLCCLLRPEVS
jgi:hypothetical protein